MSKAKDSKPANDAKSGKHNIPAVGLFGRRCARPARIVEPARALFGRRSAEAA